MRCPKAAVVAASSLDACSCNRHTKRQVIATQRRQARCKNKNFLNLHADMHESPCIYEREYRVLTSGICVRAPRGGEGKAQAQASRRGACLRSLRVQRCAAPARSPGMWDCRTRVRQSSRS
eukprot:556063-Pleurochrysis_carterae.AAC.1